MAIFNLKYHGEFTSLEGARFRVEILGKGYAGASREIEFGGDAVKLVRTSKNINEPIFGMGCLIQAWSNENYEYAGLFATSEKENKVIVKKNGEIVFVGFVDPELYEENYMPPPYLVTIPASDGLAALEDRVPRSLFSGENNVNLLDVTLACLEETGLDLPLNVNSSLFARAHAGKNLEGTGTWLEQTYIERACLREWNKGKYKYNNAKEVLEDILKPFGCRVFQSGGEWWIERVKNKSTRDWRVVRIAGEARGIAPYPGTRLVKEWHGSPASLQVDSGYGKQEIKVDDKKHDTLIYNNFDEGIGVFPYNPSPSANRYGEPRKWYRTNRLDNYLVEAFTNRYDIEQGVHTWAMIGVFPPFDNYFLYQYYLYQYTKWFYKPGDTITIRFKVSLRYADKIADTFRLYLRIELGDGNCLGKIDDNKWGIVGAPEERANTTLEFENKKKENMVKGEEVTISWEVPENMTRLFEYPVIIICPGDCIKKEGKTTTRYPVETYFGDFKVTVNEQGDEYDNTFLAEVNKKYSREAPSIEIKFFDIPRGQRPEGMVTNWNYKNGLLGKNGEGLFEWHDVLERAGTFSVVERLLKDNFDQYYDTRDKISGETISDDVFAPELFFQITGRGERNYLLVGAEWNLAGSTWKLDFEEVKGNNVTIS